MKRLSVSDSFGSLSPANEDFGKRARLDVEDIEIRPPSTSMPVREYQLLTLDNSNHEYHASLLPTPNESSIGSSMTDSTSLFYTPEQTFGFMLPISPMSNSTMPEDSFISPGKHKKNCESVDALIQLISNLSRTIIDYDAVISSRFSPDKRRECVNYISQLSRRFKFHPETTWIGVYYFDKYLSRTRVTQRKQFFLIAIGSLYLASKMEEELVEPDCSELCKKCSEHASVADIRRTERKLLSVFGWDFTYVTPHALICHLLASVNMKYRIQEIIDSIQPFLDSISLDVECLNFDVFVIAVACLKMELLPLNGRVMLRSQVKFYGEWERVKSLVSWLLTEFSIGKHVEFWDQVEVVCQRTEIEEEDDEL